MSVATSLATHRIPGRTVRISNRIKTCFVGTGNIFRRIHGTKSMRHNFIQISDTFVTTVRNSGMIDRTFKPIVSIVGEAPTRPNRINTRLTTIGETYQSTVRRIEMGLLAQKDRIANNHVDRSLAFAQILSRGLDSFLRTHKKSKKEGQAWLCGSTTVSEIRHSADRGIVPTYGTADL